MPTQMAAGLTGIDIFVRPGDEPAFEALKSDLARNLKPQTPHELHLFDLVLTAAWNIRRCIGLEAILQNEANSLGFADAFFDDELSKKLDRVHRYKRQHETSYRRALKELQQLTANRPEPEEPQPAAPQTQPTQPATTHTPPPVAARLSPESPRGA